MSTTSAKRSIDFDTDSETEVDAVHIDKRRKRRLQHVQLPTNLTDPSSEGGPGDTYANDDEYLTMELPPDGSISPQPAEGGHKDEPKHGAPVDLSASMPKGFQMMAKMGYKTGGVLGTGDGLSRALRQPLSAVGQRTRTGIKQRPPRADGEGHPEASVAEYREWLHDEESRKRNAAVLARMQKIAFELTGDIDLVTSTSDARDFNVLWRRHVMRLLDRYHSQPSTASSSSRGTPSQVAASDSLAANASPGLTASSTDDAGIHGDAGIPGDSEIELFEDLSLEEQIAQLHNFLRAELRYCFYCGTKYANDEDLYEHCPGFTEDDHH